MDRPSSARARVRATLRRVSRDCRAATAVEYGFILALVVLTMMVALVSLADTTTNMWGNISSKVQTAR